MAHGQPHGRAPRNPRPLHGARSAPRARATESTAAPWRAVSPTGARHGIHGRSMARGQPHGRAPGIHGRSMARGPAPRARSRNPRPLHGARSSATGALQESTAAPWRAGQPHGRAPRNPRPLHGARPAPRARSRNPRPLHGARASPTGARHGIHGRSMARGPAPRARSRNPRPLHGARSSATGALQESTAAPWRASVSRNCATKGCSGR